MAIDSLFIKGLSEELNASLTGARIDKIYMPRRDQVILNLRTEQGNKKLMLSVGTYPAVWLTEEKYENPDVPPMFCMLLRKQLSSGRIVSVTQPNRERIIEVRIMSSDEMGDITEKRVLCEFIGRQKNLICVNQKGIITACLRNVPPEGDKRGILPGMAYRAPRADEKPMLFDLSLEEMQRICADIPHSDGEKYLCSNIGGLTLSLAREALLTPDPAEWIYNAANSNPEPFIIYKNDDVADVSAVRINRSCACLKAEGFSKALDMFYGAKSRDDNINAQKSGIRKSLESSEKRITKKVAEQKIEREDARKRDKLKEKADLITANLGVIKAGESKVRVIDYFDPNLAEKVIELDVSISPQQNAQKLYKKYAKLKNAEIHLNEQITKSEKELEYIRSLLFALQIAGSGAETDAVRREAMDSGLVKREKKKEKSLPALPRKYRTENGYELLCGRNNTENDQLTHKIAGKKDLWFHARGVAGSHVVLVCPDGEAPKDRDIEQAASLAAYFSADKRDKVAVDYTLVKNVKKPAGGRPGAVNYFEYTSVIVKPELPREV